jgi:hypothetical protein
MTMPLSEREKLLKRLTPKKNLNTCRRKPDASLVDVTRPA